MSVILSTVSFTGTSKMIEFVHNDIKVKCKPENALKYKQLMDKPPKTRSVTERRGYPQWNPTMTTEDYLRAYIRMNDNKRMVDCGHVCANFSNIPSMYDLSSPEVLEELDAEYVEAPVKVKAKPVTSAQLKAALKTLIEAIFEGDPQTIGDEAIRAKRLLDV
jgi:hypothetical protein